MTSSEKETTKVLELTISCISEITCVMTLISLIYKNHIIRRTQETKSIVLTLTYLTIVSYIMSNTWHIIKHTTSDTWSIWDFTMRKVSNCIIYGAWIISQVLIYTLLMLRLHLSFKETKYAISKLIYVGFCIFMILFILSYGLYIFENILFIEDKLDNITLSVSLNHGIGSAYIVSAEITDFVISVILISLFIAKMNQVTADSNSHSIDREISRLNEQQNALINVSAKYFILSFVATLWTQISILLFCVVWILNDLNQTNEVEWTMWRWFLVFFYGDGIVNPICLYLLFEINDGCYHRICHRCHSLARLCFRKCTQRRMRKQWSATLEINLLGPEQ